MREPFGRTMAIANRLMKPMIQLWRESPTPPFEDYGHLFAALLANNVEIYDDVAAAMVDEDQKVALYEFGMVPQLFRAFGCAPLCLEFYPAYFARTNLSVVYEFLDAAETAGIPSDTCSTDRFILGAALSKELPDNSFFFTSSSPCDGTRIAYPILEKILDCPMLYLDAPFRWDREAIQYYAGQLKDQLIPFLASVTRREFDIDRFREVVVESNKAYEYLLDLHETFRVKPAPHPGLLRLIPYMNFIMGAGHPRVTQALKHQSEDAAQRVREGRTQGPFEEKHRVLWIHVPPSFDLELFNWMEEQCGAMVIMNSLPGSCTLEPIDPTSLDTMLEGIARQGLELTMSLMRYDTQYLIQVSLDLYERYSCDCMIVTQHVGCNSICGAHGLIRSVCREKGIPVLFVEHDYNDDRVLSSEVMRVQMEEFFSTVME